MSLYLRLTIGPVIVCDLELFGVRQTADDSNEPPAQLNGGQGTIVEPWVESPDLFGFRSTAKVDQTSELRGRLAHP